MSEPLPLNGGMIQITPAICGPTMISGGGRCGTTAMMRAVAAMGFPAYYSGDSVNAEEPSAVSAFFGSGEGWAEWMAENEYRGSRWATKIPAAVIRAAHRPDLASIWAGNWLIVVRDPVAAAVRDASLACRGVEQAVYSRTAEMLQVISAAFHLSRQGFGVFVVSYEKLCMNPSRTLADVAAWLGHAHPLLADAVDEIRPEDPRYLGSDSAVG